MSWYLRVIEEQDHRWACRWGLTRFDTHESLVDALAHLHRLALDLDGAAVFFVHMLSGEIAIIDPTVTAAVSDQVTPSPPAPRRCGLTHHPETGGGARERRSRK